MKLDDLRADFTQRGLSERDAHANPFEQFRVWMDEAVAAQMVLLRGFDERGFTFYSNRNSRKGSEIAENPRAALVFYWAELERQVRIEGHVEWTTDAESDAYFRTRPRGHRLSAWASS